MTTVLLAADVIIQAVQVHHGRTPAQTWVYWPYSGDMTEVPGWVHLHLPLYDETFNYVLFFHRVSTSVLSFRVVGHGLWELQGGAHKKVTQPRSCTNYTVFIYFSSRFVSFPSVCLLEMMLHKSQQAKITKASWLKMNNKKRSNNWPCLTTVLEADNVVLQCGCGLLGHIWQ